MAGWRRSEYRRRPDRRRRNTHAAGVHARRGPRRQRGVLASSAEMPSAGRQCIGLSLWDLADTNWLDAAGPDPDSGIFPRAFWLIGLGHLGQAFLFGLGLLPYDRPGDLHLLLQDDDIITPSTESTSIGTKKTRSMAAWAEGRGFTTAITAVLCPLMLRKRRNSGHAGTSGLCRFCCKSRGSEERRLKRSRWSRSRCGSDAVLAHATQHTGRPLVVVWRPVWRAVAGSVRSRRE